ncbi:SLAP domain-containing protein [Companilactobacillus mindensis]|uniref:SLAP domain-containing protein n=1 Tax=Companilactobacillus mindensis TaxID=167481 RepID=UPI00070FEAC9|nr:SLAP domain-containing protein [Companilactobacillus mindensis]GEO79127.1 hypothetical protein LMI01_14580 [Companilactobacillus mindensis]
MKKISIITSMLLSSAFLGLTFISESPLSISADNIENVDDPQKKVSNQIQFVDEEGGLVRFDNGKYSKNITGKIGDKINVKIPAGYTAQSDTPIYFTNDNKVHVIKVDAQEIENTIIFTDGYYDEIKRITIKGKTNHVMNIPSEQIPKGYRIFGFYDKRFSAIEKEHKIQLTEVYTKDYVTNVVVLKDVNDREITRSEIQGVEGSRYDISDLLLGKVYKFVSNDRDVIIKSEGTIIYVTVKKDEKKNIVIFNDALGNQIIQKEVYGGIDERIELRGLLPEGYTFEKDQNDYFNIKNDNYKVIVRLRKSNTRNKFIFKDINNKVIDEKNIDVQIGSYFDVKKIVPKGYVLKDPNSPYVLINDENKVLEFRIVKQQVSSHTEGNNSNSVGNNNSNNHNNHVEIQINLVDKDTKEVLRSYIIQGIHGQKINVQGIEKYDFVNDKDRNVILNKSNKSLNIFMSKKKNIGTVTKYNSVISTTGVTILYNDDGKMVGNRSLGKNSSWKIDKMKAVNGTVYYRVATNEWVKANDVKEYTIVNSVIITKDGTFKYLYTSEGKMVGNRALSKNSSWYSDKIATINGEKMYRVATNEWIKASDIK